MDSPELVASYALVFRIAERVAISAIIIAVALVVSVAFWRSLQKIDFALSRDKLSGGGSVVLATPVFALLALIGFAWVSFSNPIAVTVPVRAAPASAAALPAPLAPSEPAAAPLIDAAPGPVSFIGIAPDTAPRLGELEFHRNAARDLVRSLNCVAEAAGPLVPRDVDAFARLRLTVMQPVWDPGWGAFDAFRDWAEGRSTAVPNDGARKFFEELFPVC